MLTTAIAVAGTLLGAIVSGVIAHVSASRAEAAARRAQQRADRIEAVTALAAAASEHRAAMWTREDARLQGAPADRVHELRLRSHATRSAVTRPAVAVRLHIPDPDVLQAADEMVTTAYALRAPADSGTLDRARTDALAAHDRFVNLAAAYLQAT